MAVYGKPTRPQQNVQDPTTGKWYASAEAMAKGPKPTPHRDAKSKPTARFLTSSALDALKRIQ